MKRLWIGLWIVLLPAMALAQGGARKMPDWAVIEARTKAHFGAIKDHQPADLISRGQVEQLMDVLQALGWQVADRDEILAQVLSESDPLVKRLRTKAGKKFMRQAAGYPHAYDRLDHLERLSDGRRILDRLIDGPDGYKLIEYLTTASGGKNMGNMLSEAPGGAKFNKPTSRLYTQEQLLERLKQSYAQAQQGAGKQSGARSK